MSFRNSTLSSIPLQSRSTRRSSRHTLCWSQCYQLVSFLSEHGLQSHCNILDI